MLTHIGFGECVSACGEPKCAQDLFAGSGCNDLSSKHWDSRSRQLRKRNTSNLLMFDFICSQRKLEATTYKFVYSMMTSTNGNFAVSPANSPHKGQWRGALVFSFIPAWTKEWVNNQDAGGLRRHRAHYDVTVMSTVCLTEHLETHCFLPFICTNSNTTIRTF